MTQISVEANGGRFTLREHGRGTPLLLLHGWPEFSLTWEPVMERLASRFHLVAPDLRGFGDSSKPTGPYGAAEHAHDLVAILDALRVDRIGVVGHDVGGAVMLQLARKAPERLTGLFFFDFVYPGIGARMGTPDRLNEIWYQSFHQMDIAPQLVGATRDTCRAYLAHILRRWAHRTAAIEPVIEPLTDNFMKPGNLEGGFAYYKAAHAGRIAMMRGEAPVEPPVRIPTCVRWAEHDPLFPFAWTDRLGETFADLDLGMFPDVGHFPHVEDPDRAAAEIATFFGRL